MKSSVPSSPTVCELTEEDTPCYSSVGLHVARVQCITDVVDEAGDDDANDNDKLHHSDEMMLVHHASDAVVPCTDVQQEAACRVAQYLS